MSVNHFTKDIDNRISLNHFTSTFFFIFHFSILPSLSSDSVKLQKKQFTSNNWLCMSKLISKYIIDSINQFFINTGLIIGKNCSTNYISSLNNHITIKSNNNNSNINNYNPSCKCDLTKYGACHIDDDNYGNNTLYNLCDICWFKSCLPTIESTGRNFRKYTFIGLSGVFLPFFLFLSFRSLLLPLSLCPCVWNACKGKLASSSSLPVLLALFLTSAIIDRTFDHWQLGQLMAHFHQSW